MKISPYLEKLSSSEEFEKFKREDPKAYLCAGFFVLDFVEKKNLHQIDYYSPKKRKIITFMLDEGIKAKIAETANKKKPEQIKGKIKLDLDVLKGIVEDEMKNQMITTKIHKIIAVIQNIQGVKVWNLNCITSDMGLIKVHIEDKSGTILKFDKVNLFDVIRKL